MQFKKTNKSWQQSS